MKIPFLRKPELRFPVPEVISIKDIIAPSSIRVAGGNLQFGEKLARSFFIFSFPRYLSTDWFSPVINLDVPMDIALFAHPADSSKILKELRNKITAVQAEMIEREEKGLIRSPELEIAYRDMEALRDRLQTAQEKMFYFGLYLTVYGNKENELNEIESILRSILEGRLIYIKPALYQQREGFISTSPYNLDALMIHTPMNTGPLSSCFPFVSFDLSSNEGILYGINMHNNSLVLFDRFALENFNTCLFGKAGCGKTIRKNEPVLIKSKNKIRLVKIGPLVEKLIKKYGAIPIDEEIEGVINPGIEVCSFDKNLKTKWSKVAVAMRKKASKVYYKFTTKSGRSITTTGDHNMVVLKNGRVVVTKSSETKEGEFIPLVREIYPSTKGSHHRSNVINTNVNQYRLRLQGRGRHSPYLPTNDTFLKLAGFITSEGTVTKNFVEISNIEKEVLKVIKSAFKELKVSYRETFNRGKVDGVKMYDKGFTKAVYLLGGAGKSGNKKVWPFIFNLEKEKIAKYLSAYFEGDGGVEPHRITVAATSKSKRLISEIAYLLYYFGIIGRISKTWKKATNSDWTKKKLYWKLSISGQDNLKKFAQEINFISKRKRKQLAGIINKNGNANVDIIPGLALIFKKIHKLFGSQLYGIPEISEWKKEKRNPSPKHLKRVIHEIEQRIQNFKDLAPTFQALGKLPELASIISSGTDDKKLNTKLWQTPGTSWWVMKNKEFNTLAKNALKATGIINGDSYSISDTKRRVHFGFKTMALTMKYFNHCLQPALVKNLKSDIRYETLQKSAQYVWQNYQKILNENIPKVEERLNQLKILANSDLFWDPIVKIEKIKNKDDYVYDLQVDNEVFLAGYGGMFVHNSYAVKLEVLRSLMLGVDCIIVDPENEYEFLADAVGGSFFNISLASPSHVNPFDLPTPREDENPEDVLRSNIINLVGLMRIMLGGLTAEEDAIMDRALAETYAARDITPESAPSTWKENIPLMSDLESVLETMEGAESLLRRLRKFTTGTYASFFNQPSNVSMDNKLVVFGIRDMEEELKQMAMFIIMRYIWKTVASKLKKRVLVIDEAWWLMQTEDGASFLYGMAKRARKYWLGVTTITQDVNDFMKSEYGQPIVANSSIQILMKQSPATIDIVQKTFNLTEEEKLRLLEAAVGEGLFFAGTKHVVIRVMASYTEDQIITTAPEEVAKIRRARQALKESGGTF